jgi:hypothetical protein
MTNAFPSALGNGPIQEVFSNVFQVQGTAPVRPLIRIGRNMTIVRDGKDLTLINSIRLSPKGEKALLKLGQVKNLVQLGANHGMDDAYYKETFSPTFWNLAGTEHVGGLTANQNLTEGNGVPLPNADLFVFHDVAAPEGALVLNRDGGILITCDAVQNAINRNGYSLAGALFLSTQGFFKPVNIGPFWLTAQTKENGPTLEADFRRLLEMNFAHLFPGHGEVRRSDAREMLRTRVNEVFKK